MTALSGTIPVFASLEGAPIALKAWILGMLENMGMPEPFLMLVSIQLSILGFFSVFLLLFVLASWFERKILARIQNRRGPNRVGPAGLLQPIADGIKMLTKEDIVPVAADKVLHACAPVLIILPAFLAMAILPYGKNMTPVELEVGILLFFAVSTATELAVFMAGWASLNKFSMLGAMRAVAQILSYELPLILAATSVVMITGSLSLTAMVEAQGGYLLGILPNWHVFTPWGFAAFAMFFISALAESNRTPFDLPEGESELVAGHMTEYSGFKYALFFISEYLGLYVVCGFAVALFLGGWQAPLPFLTFIPSWIWFFAKILCLVFVAMWIRGTFPRVRVDHLMNFAWKFVIPLGVMVLVSAAVWHLAGRGPLGWILSLPPLLIPYWLMARAYGRNYDAGGRVYRFAE